MTIDRRVFLRGALALAGTTWVTGCTVPVSGSAPVPSQRGAGGPVVDVATTPTPYLPFDMPTRDERAAITNRTVFAHYFFVFESVINHRPPGDWWDDFWLPPGGKEGPRDHRAYGGLVRDRKFVGRGPGSGRRTPEENQANMAAEIRHAVDAGCDGFALELLTRYRPGGRRTDQVLDMLAAVESSADPYFWVAPMLDGTTSSTSSVEDAAQWVDQILSSGVPTWNVDGRPMLPTFAPEAAPQGSRSGGRPFWSDVLSTLNGRFGYDCHLWPVYVAPWLEAGQGPELDPIVYGHGRWGECWAAPFGTGSDSTDLAPAVSQESFGKPFLGYVKKQVDRPKWSDTFDAHGTRSLVSQWEAWIAAGDLCPAVQMVTWDDYGEGTQFAHSQISGAAWADLNAYYATWYKFGQPPEIVRDCIYLSNRRMIRGHPRNTYSSGQSEFPEMRGFNPPSDLIEARVFATEPATLEILIDGRVASSVQVPEGITSVDVEAEFGRPSARLGRGSAPIATVTSAVEITPQLVSNDELYHLASSLR
jgi:hypothetical protein